MKKDKCLKCGKKLGLFKKVPIKGGYLCKSCAKEYKESIDIKKSELKKLSLNDLNGKVEESKKQQLGAAVGMIAIVGVLVLALAIMGGNKGADYGVDNKAEDNTTATEEMNEGELKIDSEAQAFETELSNNIDAPVSATVETARKHEYKLVIINIKDENITEKYEGLSDAEQAKYRTIKIINIDHDEKHVSIQAATLITLESLMEKKFKGLNKNALLPEAYAIAEENSYFVAVKDRKGKRIDKEASFDRNDYVYTSFNKANYDKKMVVLNVDTIKHIEEEEQAEADAKAAKLEKEAEKYAASARDSMDVYVTRTGTYHISGCGDLSRAKAYQETTYGIAKNRYHACLHCFPDTYCERSYESYKDEYIRNHE